MHDYVELSDGRKMSLKDLISDYERLLKQYERLLKPGSGKLLICELKVSEWFRIDREVINEHKEEICRKCKEARAESLWKRFEESNKIADENPDQYPRIIETYVFAHDWISMTHYLMRNMCYEVGDGMCDEVICDLELQMRICNGESVDDLYQKPDRLPYQRLIKLRSGMTGRFGGSALSRYSIDRLYPAYLDKDCMYNPYTDDGVHVPYAFRRKKV